MHRYDAIVIGTGQSGPPLAARLAAAGMRVAVVERGKFGGTCVNNGCTPTKAMVASAYVARVARTADRYGVDIAGSVHVDMPRVKARKDAIVRKSTDSVERWMRSLPNASVVQGHARFVSPDTVAVGADKLTAERIFIDVGGRPLVPALPGLDRIPYLKSETMMDVDFLPEHLIVVGGSYIGLEFAQMFRRFGSRVTIVEMGPRLVGREDADVSDAVKDIVTAEDIEVDEELRTSAARVYALGDCNGRGAFTHTSYNDYEIVADNLLRGAARKVSDRVPIYALFIDPPLGRVGMSESEARRAGFEILSGKRPMTRVARAVEKGETQGFMKVTIDAKTQRILGAAILGVGGDEVVHSLVDAIYAGMTATSVAHGVRIHPTVSELIPTVLAEAKPA
jgi:pyruvate/2-oxoglutarate dehydrogenase complex dihydrolipoamide dehydrogenase (E3) component